MEITFVLAKLIALLVVLGSLWVGVDLTFSAKKSNSELAHEKQNTAATTIARKSGDTHERPQ